MSRYHPMNLTLIFKIGDSIVILTDLIKGIHIHIKKKTFQSNIFKNPRKHEVNNLQKQIFKILEIPTD